MTEIDRVCKQLYDLKIFPKVYAFKNTQLKRRKNKDAILHALKACFVKRRFQRGAWAYAEKIMQVENGNYNEAEYRSAVEREFPKEKREHVETDGFEQRIAELRKQARMLQGVG